VLVLTCINRGEATVITFLRKKQVAGRLDVHTASVDRYVHNPRYAHLAFPRPVQIGPNLFAWVESEVEDWQQAQIAKRDSAPAIPKGRRPPGRNTDQAAA